MQICTSPQTGNHASLSPLSYFTGLTPKEQRQSTEGTDDVNDKFSRGYHYMALG